ncbi:hypothetical protein AV530_006942 [Patagioenas fasciata monilis]|uniref:Uncharacterized protein n=1 Tax=Patagioenas fasciata monilis TaxID=372326 RepID=A0A1V4KXJ5_PATFA|nr:hypothetical protein AV530_006942 [Patagioenas fasciata monilis]
MLGEERRRSEDSQGGCGGRRQLSALLSGTVLERLQICSTLKQQGALAKKCKPVKHLRRGNHPGREPDWRLMGPCSGETLSGKYALRTWSSSDIASV